MLQPLSTPKRLIKAGQEVDLEKSDAIRLIDRKLAEPLRARKQEQAVQPKGERAVTNPD